MTRLRLRSGLIAVLLSALAAALLAAGTPTAEAGQIELSNLRLEGGSPPWRTSNSFDLSWDSPSQTDSYTVNYLIRDSASRPISPTVDVSVATPQLRGVQIPVPPGLATVPRGSYSIELWVKNSVLNPISTTIGFDDQAPAPARPSAPDEWLRAGSYAEIEIEHPAAPLPASGIRGYAVLLDHSLAGEPCASPNRCSEAETDLDGGIDDDRVRFGPLLEETNIVRVAAVSNAGLRSSELGAAVLHVDGTPPRIGFHGLPDGWSNQPVQVSAIAEDPLSGTAAGGPEGALTVLSVDGGAPTRMPGGRASSTVQGDGYHWLRATARDAVGNATDEAEPVRAVLRIDETPPRVAFGPRQDPGEPERILASVDDGLSGPASRGTIAVRPTGSSQPFEPLATVARAGQLTALWDSDSYPPGSYEFKATGYDLAGNETNTTTRADGTSMVLPNPLKTATSLAFGFGGKRLVWRDCARGANGVECERKTIAAFDRRPAARTVPFGHTVPVSGRLTSAGGAPLAGLPVEVSETFAPGSTPQRRTTTVLTRANGSFLARLAPGPNRRVAVSFAGTRQLSRSGGRVLQLGVRGRVRLRASAASVAVGGAPVVFTGRLDRHDAVIPATGLAVELQFQVLGSPWSEFRTVQTDAFGRFSYSYSFSDDDSRGIRFQFRAAVPAQAGWPYESGASKPVAVTGR